ncbi:hypothetical protein LC55x_1630 [Lysobacter capsici]|nr:hypothetical protein LC55x_1630 [Lysobacter capsici]
MPLPPLWSPSHAQAPTRGISLSSAPLSWRRMPFAFVAR